MGMLISGRGKIFATLPRDGWGMVALLPSNRSWRSNRPAFKLAAGAWGRGGSTLVELDQVSTMVERSIEWAWRKRAPARLRS